MEITTSNDAENGSDFYDKGKLYWSEIAPTVDGMLGGYGHVTRTDVQGSRHFLKQIYQSSQAPDGAAYALDCGAGIGRVTQHLLLPFFERVDLVEQNAEFLDQAKHTLNPDRCGEFYPIGLHEFEPAANRYDVIWIQWVMGHLTDDDFVAFLTKCRVSLKPNGIIVIKENITSTNTTEIDDKDSSYTRSFTNFMQLFEKANYSCFKKQKQSNFPKELYTVYMFAIKPT